MNLLLLAIKGVSDHGDQIQSMSWRGDGVAMATSCKDKQNRILDPRAGKIVQVITPFYVVYFSTYMKMKCIIPEAQLR